MEIQTNTPLKDFTTMRLGGPARFIATATNKDELASLVTKAKQNSIPFFIIGGGSNIIVKDEGYSGLVILDRISGFEIVSQDAGGAIIRVGGGENWDATVERTVGMGLSGIETMSGVPGTAGATPVQNVGAYGQEISDTLIELEAYDTNTDQFVTLQNADCGFAYRNSIFKDPAKRHHIIVSVTLKLKSLNPAPPFYESLQKYLDAKSVTYYTPATIRDAVLAIRSEKLPDPTVYPNTGSFFKNPVIERWLYDDLLKEYPDMPSYEMEGDNVKIPAGWLIEQAEMKGHASHGMKTYEKNALVFVNMSAENYADLEAFKEEIRGAVRDKFRISLEQEPETLG
jgi:UDP-N-acetylmuramate dehydrogenase